MWTFSTTIVWTPIRRWKKPWALNELATQRGQTLAQMALAWVLRDGIVNSVLAGASRPEQVLDNIKAAQNTVFTADELKRIEQICLL